jgi:hypothetical protein
MAGAVLGGMSAGAAAGAVLGEIIMILAAPAPGIPGANSSSSRELIRSPEGCQVT